MQTKQQTLRNRLFYLILRVDVELAETFLARSPNTNSVKELNDFFRLSFSKHNLDSRKARGMLDDTMDEEAWIHYFMQDVLPILREWRFPEETNKKAVSFYAPV